MRIASPLSGIIRTTVLVIVLTGFPPTGSLGSDGSATSPDGPPPVPTDPLPNLRPILFGGWTFPLVPRTDGLATPTDVQLPPILPDVTGIYLNYGVYNEGDGTSPGIYLECFLDGNRYLDFATTSQPVPRGTGMYAINHGPIPYFMRHGRHTLEMRIDPLDAVEETDETDNEWGYQFVWAPQVIPAGSPWSYGGGFLKEGGWDAIPDGTIIWYNAFGYRIHADGWWNIVYLRPRVDSEDWDCRLHEPSTGSLDGFGLNIGWSQRGAGATDAIIINNNVMAEADWDIGVINGNEAANGFNIYYFQETAFTFGDTLSFLWSNQYLRAYEVHIGMADRGWVLAALDAEQPSSPMHIAWYDKEFDYGVLQDYDAHAVTDADGRAQLFLDIPEAGYYLLVVYRDDDNDGVSFTTDLTIGPLGPDFAPYDAPGWHSPCVPRPAADGTVDLVALPDTLHGNAPLTWFNTAICNLSPTAQEDPPIWVHVEYDDQPTMSFSFNPLIGYGTAPFNGWAPYSVPGGRHTLAMRIDKDDVIAEFAEDNNVYGEQYCWSPAPVTVGSSTSRSNPPPRDAGWSTIGSGELVYYNCDGLRMPAGSVVSGWWRALAVMPSTTSDLDVRLHKALHGVKSGFGSNLVSSNWGLAESEYVLVDFNQTVLRTYDVGVVNVSGGSGSYRLQAVESEFRDHDPQGTYGPFDLLGGRLLDLHEFNIIDPGVYTFALLNQSGTVDWGMTLHRDSYPFQNKSGNVTGGTAWTNGPGQDESFTVQLDSPGFYCLAVWKRSPLSTFLSGTYQLYIQKGPTAVPDPSGSPQATALVASYPNPFNPRLTVTYEVAADGPVEITVYDLRGRKIRTLFAGPQPPGHHRTAWDGRDGAGRNLPSGVYVVRLTSPGASDTRKVVLSR